MTIISSSKLVKLDSTILQFQTYFEHHNMVLTILQTAAEPGSGDDLDLGLTLKHILEKIWENLNK